MGCGPACLALGLGTYRPPPPKPPIVDRRGKRWCSTGMVYGECEDHLLPQFNADGPLRWEGGGHSPTPRKPPVVTPAAPPPVAPPGRPVALRGLGEASQGPVVVWVDDGSACSMPTLAGMIAFGLLGAHAARRGRGAAGAMDGVFGSWLGCAAASAMGLTGGISTLASLAGAYYAAKVFDGSGR